MSTNQAGRIASRVAACLEKGEAADSAPINRREPALRCAETGLVLRVCTAHENRHYPKKISVADGKDIWFNGWLYGEGDYLDAELMLRPDIRFQVVEVLLADLVHLKGGVLFSRGRILHTGDRHTAARYLEQHEPRSKSVSVIGACRHVGNRRRVHVGAAGFATAGHHGSAFAGAFGFAVSLSSGVAIAGHNGTASVGNGGHARAGDCGTATAGEAGRAYAGNRGSARALTNGIASAGQMGTATVGDSGLAIVGDHGCARAGLNGCVSAGRGGEISLRYLDRQSGRLKTVIGHIGESGLLPDVIYKLDLRNQFVAAANHELTQL